MVPTVLEDEDPQLVVWSSIWQDAPDLRIRFEIEPGGGGSYVTWILLGPPDVHDASDIARRRYRLNEIVNGGLRSIFDQ